MGREIEKTKRIPGFVERLKELMGDMDNTTFAKHVGLSRQTLGYYLNGNRLPDANNIIKICRACNVSSDYLLGLSDVRSADGSVQAACDYTGLTEPAVKILHKMGNSGRRLPGEDHPGVLTLRAMLSRLLVQREMGLALSFLADAEYVRLRLPEIQAKRPGDYFGSEQEYAQVLYLMRNSHLVLSMPEEQWKYSLFEAKQLLSNIVDSAFGQCP